MDKQTQKIKEKLVRKIMREIRPEIEFRLGNDVYTRYCMYEIGKVLRKNLK